MATHSNGKLDLSSLKCTLDSSVKELSPVSPKEDDEFTLTSRSNSWNWDEKTVNADDTPAKKAKSKKALWLELGLIQIPPTAITLTLFGLYWKGFGWDPTSDQINMLLVGAKVWEYFMIGSLSAILLSRIRLLLRSSRGVPLGYLTSPFQLNSAYYLLSRQFWRATVGSATPLEDYLTTKIMILAVICLAVAIGPSTGIIMLPKLDWWPNPPPVYFNPGTPSIAAGTTLINATYDALYPRAVDASLISSFCRWDLQPDRTTAPDPDIQCPYGGLPQLLYSLPQVRDADYIPTQLFNFSVMGTTHTRGIALGWDSGPDAGVDSAVAYATSPMDIVTRELNIQGINFSQHSRSQVRVVSEAMFYYTVVKETPDYFLNETSANSKPWRQPAVAVQCASVRRSGDSYVVDFAAGPFVPPTMRLPAELIDAGPGNGTVPGITFFEPTGAFPANVSAAIVARTSGATRFCLVAAKWAESDVWVSKPADDVPASGVSVDPVVALHGTFETSADNIVISPEWAGLLNTTVNTTDTGSGGFAAQKTVAAFSELPGRCGDDADTTRCLAISLSLYLTDALARLHYFWDMYVCHGRKLEVPDSETSCERISDRDGGSGEDSGGDSGGTTITVHPGDLPAFTAVSSSYFRMQYAYRFGQTELVAWIFLWMHVVLVVMHVTHQLLRKRTWEETEMEDVGSLVALAMRSRPTEELALVGRRAWQLKGFLEDDAITGRAELRLRRGARPRVWARGRSCHVITDAGSADSKC